MKVALLVRVSSSEQSYDRQVSELTAYAQSQSWEVVSVIEEKVSGSKTRLSDRLGRRTRDLLEVIEYLHEHKVSLVVYNYRMETIDHRGRVNSMTQFMITLLGDIGRMETETLSERTKSGLEEAQRKGKRIGRPEGTSNTKADYFNEYPGVVKDLKAGLSLRQIASIRKVSDKTVQKVKSALLQTSK